MIFYNFPAGGQSSSAFFSYSLRSNRRGEHVRQLNQSSIFRHSCKPEQTKARGRRKRKRREETARDEPALNNGPSSHLQPQVFQTPKGGGRKNFPTPRPRGGRLSRLEEQDQYFRPTLPRTRSRVPAAFSLAFSAPLASTARR